MELGHRGIGHDAQLQPGRQRAPGLFRAPWFDSGIGEVLGVVVASPPVGTTLPSGLQPFVSGFGAAPVGLTSPATRSIGTRTGACGSRTSPSVPASRTSPSSSWHWSAVSPPPCRASSPLGLCEQIFIQLTPNRSMGLTYPSDTEVAVEVLGPGYLATATSDTPDTVRAYLQLKAVKTSNPDLQWITDPAQSDGTLLTVTSLNETTTVWKGRVKLPKARGTAPTGSSLPSSKSTSSAARATVAQR